MAEEKNSPGKKEEKEEAPDLETLKARLDVSVNMARSLVTSWLPPEDEPEEDNRETNSADTLKGRAPRLGLGAKFLSHAQGTGNAVGKSMIESKMKRKLTAVKTRDEDEPYSKKVEQEDSEDEDSRTATSKSSKKPKKAISGGDFLSQYLNERQTKKKKKGK
ncbi:hypothetical protein K493DRAFT_334665 [Basidiobolus meristosporus CBS 931.73]|uniref:Uncharacterized protein n=1 Tax=Basidiobolus meristosporus CBS 931.73 TaxID=1314790 RepID=A0A1Y1YXC9_9FUNG|nr:hypothetical protein K493DRAFT_334665 [Basidiobolus meristosporus CBS 931.73]|eukprot:ORY02327.1 hypothetical protein K493DRAFT_334665 [Basidiobolus meristosporus CBS 931.73]